MNDYRGVTSADEFEFTAGSIPVLISAPHAVTHMRDGTVKPSEDYTGAIALAVAKATDCHALVATRTGAGDPNRDPLDRCRYKQALCSYVRDEGITCVLDVHGMVAASDALVAVGSADGKTVVALSGFDDFVTARLRERLNPWCVRFGKPIALNGRYGARGSNTVSQTVARECGIAALQIEVATQMRVPTRRHPGIPRDEPPAFTSGQLSREIEARRLADPQAVGALIKALCEVAVSVQAKRRSS